MGLNAEVYMGTSEQEQPTPGVVVPRDRIAPEVLQRIIEEFVLEEGTDYGHEEFSLENKVESVRKQLDSGQLELVFNPETETCSIRSRLSARG